MIDIGRELVLIVRLLQLRLSTVFWSWILQFEVNHIVLTTILYRIDEFFVKVLFNSSYIFRPN